MRIVSLPTSEEDGRKVLAANPTDRISKQNQLVEMLGIKTSGRTPFMDYFNFLQRLNGLQVTNDIQEDLYNAVESDPQAHRFLMILS